MVLERMTALNLQEALFVVWLEATNVMTFSVYGVTSDGAIQVCLALFWATQSSTFSKIHAQEPLPPLRGSGSQLPSVIVKVAARGNSMWRNRAIWQGREWGRSKWFWPRLTTTKGRNEQAHSELRRARKDTLRISTRHAVLLCNKIQETHVLLRCF